MSCSRESRLRCQSAPWMLGLHGRSCGYAPALAVRLAKSVVSTFIPAESASVLVRRSRVTGRDTATTAAEEIADATVAPHRDLTARSALGPGIPRVVNGSRRIAQSYRASRPSCTRPCSDDVRSWAFLSVTADSPEPLNLECQEQVVVRSLQDDQELHSWS